jgi:TIR domain
MGSSPDHEMIGDIPLRLADTAKAIENAPSDIALGTIRLGAWQLHQLSPLPPDYADHAGYLIRVNYDFDIAVGVPPPGWAEVSFCFPDEITVVDALPRSVSGPENARSYAVTGHLNFVPGDGAGGCWPPGALASGVALPPVRPRIDCFGLGSRKIRWRHSGTPAAEVPVGSHTGWLVLVTPRGREVVQVLASGHYWLEVDPDLELVSASRRDAFTVRLSAQTVPSARDQIGTVMRSGRPRVFISYSHEASSQGAPAHKADVIRLWKLLEQNGIDVRIDQQGLDGRRIWADWSTTAILRSDFTIVVASPAYLAASEDRLPPEQNPSVRSEYLRLADLLHHDTARWIKKILPVVLPGRSVEEIPLAFLPHIADHYLIDNFTAEGAASLLQVLHSGRGSDSDVLSGGQVRPGGRMKPRRSC